MDGCRDWFQGRLAIAVMPVLQTPEIGAVATVCTGNPYFVTAGANNRCGYDKTYSRDS